MKLEQILHETIQQSTLLEAFSDTERIKLEQMLKTKLVEMGYDCHIKSQLMNGEIELTILCKKKDVSEASFNQFTINISPLDSET